METKESTLRRTNNSAVGEKSRPAETHKPLGPRTPKERASTGPNFAGGRRRESDGTRTGSPTYSHGTQCLDTAPEVDSGVGLCHGVWTRGVMSTPTVSSYQARVLNLRHRVPLTQTLLGDGRSDPLWRSEIEFFSVTVIELFSEEN